MACAATKKRKNEFPDKRSKQAKQTNMGDTIHSQENRHSSLLLSLDHIRIFAMRRPKPACVTNENWLMFNVTSKTKEKWCLEFSPFLLGPIELYPNSKDGKMWIAKNMENAWQFCKVYRQFTDIDGNSPSEAYWKWAEKGWNDSKPHRFPLGRVAVKPLYSLWNGKQLSYIEARKTIYAPLYAKYVEQTDAYRKLNEIYIKYCCGDQNDKHKKPMGLLDFDGWDHLGQDYTLEQVINMEKPKMGHAFVLAGLLENNLFWLSESEKTRAEELRKSGRLLKDI
ncbi:unnamed protein product [Rotaria magnacalcarata]|uniref:Uncharacterized protein n=1 Tax=Rotaria magnacalcarata TaxID=392030 RepID=A0A820IJF3_9BILA|nr:unnamed protein product [Rotaria magnacalcarata]CAF1637054.1 unnamed protein product [Rotaria magnacalcarata]CAF2105727.1 unnamed protein product [Rotaria magnacalcarata]CAF2211212.1 unnamed protein product [Rotaria magnacalcarata]CAF2239425.1 unnamed protein product [Rotaria magnacalcarata]